MLLSAEHKFIFIHVPKTAGSAMHNALLPYATIPRRTLLSSGLRRLPITESANRAHFRIHETAQKIRSKLSDAVWRQYFTFAVVRNPFDHAISHFEYMKQYRNRNIAEKFSKLSFEEYLEYRLSSRGVFDRVFAKMPNQSYFIAENGRLLVNKIIKYENLSNDLVELSVFLNGIKLDLKKTNITNSKKMTNKTDYYKNRNAVDLAVELYSPDFELCLYNKNPEFI